MPPAPSTSIFIVVPLSMSCSHGRATSIDVGARVFATGIYHQSALRIAIVPPTILLIAELDALPMLVPASRLGYWQERQS